MAIQFKATTSTISDLTLHMQMPGAVTTDPQMEIRQTFFPAEWYPQSGVQLTWPHADTDWAPDLAEVDECFIRIALEVLMQGEWLLIVTPEPERVRTLVYQRLPARLRVHVRYAVCATNDTWARDHAFLTLVTESGPLLLDYQFNGWGMKFASNFDNQICRSLASDSPFAEQVEFVENLDFVFEGGSIESDGHGTLMTTAECLLSPNRNPSLTREQIEERLLHDLHAQRLIWIEHGALVGDDTDSHIDTLARFAPNDTIAYVQCTDPADEHFESLKAMEVELQALRTRDNKPYNLVPLPLPEAMCDPDDGHRLPATYANFLVINNAVLMPTYGQPDMDELAKRQLQKAFPRHDIVCIDCRVLVRQHGSLHCSTMQYPIGVF